MLNPSKTAFYKKLYIEINKKKYNSVLDIGCGEMDLIKNIKCQNYLGIDKYNPKKIINNFKKCSIENFRTKKKFDLVCCIQVIGINSKFNNIKIFSNIKKIISLVRNNGHLAINFGPIVSNEKIDQIIKLFKFNNLEIITHLTYGLFYFKTNKILFRFINLLLKIFPNFDMLTNNKFNFFLLKKNI
jgi:nitrogen regulatory protein PII-like uncharacterized protein